MKTPAVDQSVVGGKIPWSGCSLRAANAALFGAEAAEL